jgi:hypothetical protein
MGYYKRYGNFAEGTLAYTQADRLSGVPLYTDLLCTITLILYMLYFLFKFFRVGMETLLKEL